jgi:hypothetical protein
MILSLCAGVLWLAIFLGVTNFAPVSTFNAQAGLLASGSLAASGTSTTALDISTKFEAQIQVKNTGGGSVAGTNGLQVDVFRRFGAGPTDDTISILTFIITTTASTTKYQSFTLPTGKYDIKLTNLDASNAITVEMTSTTVDTISG